MEQAGVRVATRVDDGLAFTRPGDTAGLLVEWFSKRQPDDPRWGAPEPPFVRPPVVAPTRMAFVGAIVDDPVSVAWHLGEVFDTEVSVLAVDGPGGAAPGDGRARRLLPRAVPDPVQPGRERARVGTGLRPRPLPRPRSPGRRPGSCRARALLEAGVAVHCRVSDGAVVLDPASLPFPVVLTDRLLPGDPRA